MQTGDCLSPEKIKISPSKRVSAPKVDDGNLVVLHHRDQSP